MGYPIPLGDPGRLRQILTNLAGNAVKFTHQGEVAVTVSRVQETEERNNASCLLRFSVRDTGIGIPADKVGMLFQQFTQVDASTTRHSAREALPDFAHRKARILLAEDNITNQLVTLGILKKLGLSADAVANGREVIEALRTLPYDLVLMDVQMPEMDGLEATRRIRAMTAGSRRDTSLRIPIIAMTANAMKGDKEECLEAGMDDYIAKPVTPRALAEALEKWLPEKNGETPSLTPPVPPSAPADQSSALVFNGADLLERLIGDEELIEILLQGFLEDLPQQIENLRAHLDARDTAGVRRQAHAIKGAAANMGAEGIRTLASELEKAGGAENVEAIKRYSDNLDAAFEAFKKATAWIHITPNDG